MNIQHHNPSLGLSAALGAILLVMLAASTTASANESQAIAVEADASSCPTEFTDQFVDELRLRSTAQLIVSPSDSEPTQAQWTVLLSGLDQQSCQARLREADDSRPLVVSRDADRVEIASAANRMAWIIDGSGGPAAEPQPYVEEAVDPRPAISASTAIVREAMAISAGTAFAQGVVAERAVDEPTQSAPLDSGQATRHRFSAEALAGPLWIPSADTTLMLIRLKASWKPLSQLQIGVTGRLPLSTVNAQSGGVEYGYRPWSIDLTAGVIQRLSQDWTLNLSAGLRNTLSQVWARDSRTDESTRAQRQQNPVDTPVSVGSQRDSSWHDTLSKWSVVANAGASYSLFRGLTLRADGTLATSLTERTLSGDQDVVVNLGYFDLDLLLGLQWRF